MSGFDLFGRSSRSYQVVANFQPADRFFVSLYRYWLVGKLSWSTVVLMCYSAERIYCYCLWFVIHGLGLGWCGKNVFF